MSRLFATLAVAFTVLCAVARADVKVYRLAASQCAGHGADWEEATENLVLNIVKQVPSFAGTVAADIDATEYRSDLGTIAYGVFNLYRHSAYSYHFTLWRDGWPYHGWVTARDYWRNDRQELELGERGPYGRYLRLQHGYHKLSVDRVDLPTGEALVATEEDR